MIRLIYLYLTVITLTHALPKRKIGRQDADQENKDDKKSPSEKFKDVEDDPYVRYIIEEGVKNPLFGSSRFDPINQVFLISDKAKPTTKSDPGKTTDVLSSTVMTEGPTEAMETESQTQTAAPPGEDRKQFVNALTTKPCKTGKGRTTKGHKTTNSMKPTGKKQSKTSTRTTEYFVTESAKQSHETEGWWSRRRAHINISNFKRSHKNNYIG